MDIDSYAELCKANRVLQADMDAAQDEIERLVIEKEALRERLDWEQPEPDADVIQVGDYTLPDWDEVDDPDRPHWVRTRERSDDAPSEWKGYKNGYKTYLDWPELVRRWGPLTVTMRSGSAS